MDIEYRQRTIYENTESLRKTINHYTTFGNHFETWVTKQRILKSFYEQSGVPPQSLDIDKQRKKKQRLSTKSQ